MNILIKVADLIADPTNETMNHAIDRAGQGSIVAGGALKAAEVTGVIQEGLTLTDWVAIVAIIGGLLYIVKLTIEIIISRRKL